MKNAAIPAQLSLFACLRLARLYARTALCAGVLLAVFGTQEAAMSADDTDIPADVIQSLDAARAGNPLWTPKFKKLSYTISLRNPGLGGSGKETTMVEAQPHGLLRMTRIKGSRIDQVLSFAGLFMLKMETTGSEVITTTDADGRVLGKSNRQIEEPALVTRRVKLELPAELKPGAVFGGGTAMVAEKPGKTDYTDRDMLPGEGMECKVKERLDASAFFSSLTGKAVSVDCLTSAGLSDIRKREALVYIEDLGLFIDLGRQSPDGSPSAVITDMKIER